MYCLIEKETNRIVLDAILDEGEWLGQGAVCWAPCFYCNEDEEDQEGYYTAEIDEEELCDEDGEWLARELYYIDGKVCRSDEIEDDDDEDLPSNCISPDDLNDFCHEKNPQTHLMEVRWNFKPSDSSESNMTYEKTQVPISEGMRDYLLDYCPEWEEWKESDISIYDLDEPTVADLKYIAEHSSIPYDWTLLLNVVREHNDASICIEQEIFR